MNTKKVLFIFPNTANSYAIPQAIAILAGIAKGLHWERHYFDTCVYKKETDSMEERVSSGEFKPLASAESSTFKPLSSLIPDLQRAIDKILPNIIAISTTSFEYQFLLDFLPRIEVPRGTLIILGGIHAILEPEAVINSGLFELVCTGEGEETFEEILIEFEKNRNLSKISNTYFRNRQNGAITKNAKNNLIKEDRLWETNADYSLFDENYFLYPFDGKLYRRFSFETGRGCPFSCTYCGSLALKERFRGLGEYIRIRPIESIKEKMRELVVKYGIELFYFEDECFLAHPGAWLEEFILWYGQNIRKPFILQTRLETIDEDKLELLKKMRAPFFQISVGVESGSRRILFDVCNRKTEVEVIVHAFGLLQKHRIRTCAFFIIGLPYETREDIFKSIELCRLIRPTVIVVSIFQPLPGQKLRETCIKEGYISGNERLTTFTGDSILRMPQLSSQEILNLRRVFVLYATLPKEYYPEIEKCEKDFVSNQQLYNKLLAFRWDNQKIYENQ